ncbi:hypothetical protein J2W91_002874 [Paenibacillus amylolyticus]|uniref:Uncharacterized protein n=1 Tax=Paenibacillus amylolyticus TaxID=1451 RepID=A0AAP5H3P2_PAEAM|nr:hypothetical protein [Paenibacillus amylolyticus]
MRSAINKKNFSEMKARSLADERGNGARLLTGSSLGLEEEVYADC